MNHIKAMSPRYNPNGEIMKTRLIEIAHDAINSINAIYGFEEIQLSYISKHESKQSVELYTALIEKIALLACNSNRNDEFIYESAVNALSDELEYYHSTGEYLINSFKFQVTFYSLLTQQQKVQIAAIIIAAQAYTRNTQCSF